MVVASIPDKKDKTKLFLGILLTEQSVQAVLWSIEEAQIKILEKSKIHQIIDADKSLTQTDLALQELGEGSEDLSEVVFGLEPSWTNANGVIDTKKPLLKSLTEELSLKAVGFVILTEAVIKNLINKQPNLNAVLVFYSITHVSIAVLENGESSAVESVGRSEDAVGDLVEALARLKTKREKEFPAQLKLISISLDKEELFEQQQLLIDHDWVGEGHFVGVPTISTEDQSLVIESLVNQGGLAVAKVEDIPVDESEKSDHAKLPPVEEVSANDFSFKEVELEKQTKNEPESNDHPDDNLAVTVTKSFGIPIQTKPLPEVDQTIVTDSRHDQDENEIVPQKTKKKTNKFLKWLLKNKLFVGIGFGAGIIALLVIFAVFMTVSGQAQVILTLNQRPLSKDLEITLDPSLSESDFDSLTLKSELASSDFSLNQTNETTGTTLVGEKARGKVQIVNKTDGVKTFSAGTSFTAGDLRFTLDDDVTVASASVEVKQNAEVKTYGNSEANLTAVKIGAEGNIGTDTAFKISEFSDSSYEARSIAAFAGGSSRELRVVSETDQNQLLAEVKKKILELAAQKFKEDSIASGEQTLVSTGKITVLETKYSSKVGDEAKTLTLDLSAQVEAIAYQNQDLKPLAEHVLSDLVPDGFEMANKDPEILSAVDTTASGSAIVISANISSRALPKIDLENLKKEIAGQSLSSAEAILNGKGEIKNHSINLIPAIMESLWKKIPNNPNNINIVIE